MDIANKYRGQAGALEASVPRVIDQKCDLVAVFVNPGQTNLMGLDWIQFNLR